MGSQPPTGGGPGSDPSQPPATPPTESSTFTETPLTVMMKLTIVPGATVDAAPTATIDITARDGSKPVITDLWLYTLDGTGAQLPLTQFTSTAPRRSPRLMLPAMIMGQPSGFQPADDGRQNGLMTNTSRGSLKQGAFVNGITGTATVTLPAAPTQPILVVAGVEDQRYAGAAVINPDGTPGQVPAGVGEPETHTRLSFARDVEPITTAHCSGCHNSSDTGTYMSRPGGSLDDLVNDNVGLALGTRTCKTNNPQGGTALDQCIQAITSAFFLVEPGVPAVSAWLARTRPDETGNASANGLKWWGISGARYAADYGDHRMPSTCDTTDLTKCSTAEPTDFDMDPQSYLTVWNWVAQGAAP